MGNEFLFKKIGSLRKSRERQKEKVQNELPECFQRNSIVSAKLLCDANIAVGEQVEICVEDDAVTVFKERNKIAFIPAMSSALKDRIRNAGGRILGRLDRKLSMSNQLDIAVSEIRGTRS